MTEAQSPLVVTQADRDAAADLMLALFENSQGLEAEAAWSETVRRGEDDAYPVVSAFARHRLNTRPPADPDNEGLADYIAPKARRTIERIADAVVTLSRETVTALEHGEAVAKECAPLFEALGMNCDVDGWGFDEDLFPALATAPRATEADPDNEGLARVVNDIAVMMSEFVDNWPAHKRIETSIALIAKTLRAALATAPRATEADPDNEGLARPSLNLDEAHLPLARAIADQLCEERPDFDPKTDADDCSAWFYARNGAWLALATAPRAEAEQIADTPGAGLISDEDGLRELRLLYNYAEDDSRQFTRWQMLVAMNHGRGLATEADTARALNEMTHFAADERDRTILLSALLERARWYVNDALEAHEHSDGRDLLNEIGAALPPTTLSDGASNVDRG